MIESVTLSIKTFEQLLKCKDFVTMVASKGGFDPDDDPDVEELVNILREATDIREGFTK